MEKWIVDRIESGFAIVENEDGELYDISLSLLPDVEEGDIIKVTVKSGSINKKKNNKNSEFMYEDEYIEDEMALDGLDVLDDFDEFEHDDY